MELEKKLNLDSFKKAQQTMIAASDDAWRNSYGARLDFNINQRIKPYTPDEVARIIESGNLSAQQKLSRYYFYKDGFYRRIILYYATLLKYNGLIIPNSDKSQNLSKSNFQKRYNNAIDFIELMKLPELLTNISWRVLVDGVYYGIILNATKKAFSVMDLPYSYCRTRFKDENGNDVIEFNVSYFLNFNEQKDRQAALDAYPDVISSYFKKWKNNKVKTPWVFVPIGMGICFRMFDARPLFLNVIPATIQYDDAVDTDRERDKEEIRKIIVQKIPHLQDGGLLFEPDEAVEIHSGTVGMMKGNKNVSVLTTYADVDSIVSKTQNDNASSTIEKMRDNIYGEAGVSGQVFAATGNLSVEISIKNDVALMMVLANKYSTFITSLLNKNFSNSSLSFKYMILDISYYNESTYITDSFKLAQSGYSFMLPALAQGLSQRDIVNIKDLENNVLELDKKLIPLQSAYTQSGEVGRPKKADDQKSDKTIANERSLDNQGGTE